MKIARTHWRILLALGMLVLAMLACGGFQVRDNPTVTPPPSPTVQPVAAPATSTPPPPPGEPAPAGEAPTAAPAAAASPEPGEFKNGDNVRVVASGGLNVRDQPGGDRVGRLNPGDVVKVQDGPTDAEGYTWWKVDSGVGLVGWVAAGTPDEAWLVLDVGIGPAAGGGRLIDRPIRLGDRVQVTTEDGKLLTIRQEPGLTAPEIARALSGTQFIVRAGPQYANDFRWWRLEGAEYSGWAAEGPADDRWLTPVEP